MEVKVRGKTVRSCVGDVRSWGCKWNLKVDQRIVFSLTGFHNWSQVPVFFIFSSVNESRQVLQEPEFAQSLLRDPNTPIIRKSRGTSTQGTSTHASSQQLAMDDQRSKAGSVHSKLSSYHGSLHRSRDGRWADPRINLGWTRLLFRMFRLNYSI